ncbi:MAG: hypothetical protein ACUVV1_05890 [Fimbriimonadales bacterium]
MTPLNERYIVDAEGKPIAVVLDIQVYRELLEALETLEDIQAYDAAKASGESPIPLEQALESLEKRSS